MTGYAPLLRGDNQVIARQRDRVISRATFLAEIEDLAGQLPDRPYVVNLCADRYRFTVAWAAAMLRDQVTLLPGSGDAFAVAALRADYPSLYVLTDNDPATDNQGVLPGPLFAYPRRLGAGTASRVPAFPPDQIAAVLFTSGSSGRPNPGPRRWGRLVASSLAAGTALGIARFRGAALIATVPHAHSYGLESAVMLPLQHGLLLTADRPFFPADVVAALDNAAVGCAAPGNVTLENAAPANAAMGGATSANATSGRAPSTPRQPGVLVTTPVHLRALVGDAATSEPGPGFGVRVRAGFVLSATAPLSEDLAARAEATFGASVFEIYGCSEAGQIATRRTTDGPVWHCLKGIALRQTEAGTWASGPNEDDVLLADAIEPVGDGRFVLLGRAADMVNIAGKRASLAFLTGQLMAIDGVTDGVFLMPNDGVADTPSRLAAVAVAPGRDAATILAALRGRIDPAFLPRPLHLVDTLPRDALGKLPRAEILRLVNPPVVAMEPTATAPILLCFPTDHPAGPGHFPGDPIIPGAVLLDEVVPALCPDGWSREIESAKFHHPVRPGDAIALTHRTTGEITRFECRLAKSGQLVLSGALRPPSPSR